MYNAHVKLEHLAFPEGDFHVEIAQLVVRLEYNLHAKGINGLLGTPRYSHISHHLFCSSLIQAEADHVLEALEGIIESLENSV